jgi:hypothetical protein
MFPDFNAASSSSRRIRNRVSFDAIVHQLLFQACGCVFATAHVLGHHGPTGREHKKYGN